MVYRIAGAIYFIVVALGLLGIATLPAVLVGVIALVAGIALLAGQ